jgi:flagellar hook-associated protein 2
MKTSAGNIADATTGSVAITLTSLDTQVQQLNDRQTAAQARIDDQKKQLSKQFTAMEAAISKLNNTGSFLTSQFKQLGG